MCRRDEDGHWHGTFAVCVRFEALWRLGLHPSQLTSVAADPLPPKWWGPWGR
ncbi:hypothetical protein [Kitasatospora sp. NPDC101183]|uniref:hypothetical protein n=1 Tax=Kitasatospora sp. NPDC101183 TaxID=3364100 RepID=UPI00381C5432